MCISAQAAARWDWTADVLNNQALAAFLGAFSAFLLVAATDYWRRRRKVKLIRSTILLDKLHAEKKLIQVNRNIERLRDAGQIQAAPFMPFSPDRLVDLQTQVLDILSDTQNLSIDALIFWMNAINGQLAKALEIAEGIVAMVHDQKPIEKRAVAVGLLLTNFQESVVNIQTFISMADMYSRADFKGIVEMERPALE